MVASNVTQDYFNTRLSSHTVAIRAMCWHHRWTWGCHEGHLYDWIELCEDGEMPSDKYPEGIACGNADSTRTADLPLRMDYENCRAPECCKGYIKAKSDIVDARRKARDAALMPDPLEKADLVERVNIAKQALQNALEYHDRCKAEHIRDVPILAGRMSVEVPGCDPREPAKF
jgi:hypothetical protein